MPAVPFPQATTALIFLLILLYHEEDLSGRAGVFQLNFEKKKILLEHYLSGYIKIEFLLLIQETPAFSN